MSLTKVGRPGRGGFGWSGLPSMANARLATDISSISPRDMALLNDSLPFQHQGQWQGTQYVSHKNHFQGHVFPV